MKLTLTVTEAYQRKQKLWRVYCEWSQRVRRAFFPDTGGVSLLMHNWYKCAEKTNPEGAKLANWVDDSTYARYKRLEAKMEARDTEREHLRHSQIKRFDPLWCPICHPERF